MHRVVKQIASTDVYITKADESNNVVILDKSVYDERVNKLISEGPYEPTESDPLTSMVKEENIVLNKHMNVWLEKKGNDSDMGSDRV